MLRVDRKRHPAFLPTLLQSGSPVCYKTLAGGAKSSTREKLLRKIKTVP
jgi:hypothetical protein